LSLAQVKLQQLGEPCTAWSW